MSGSDKINPRKKRKLSLLDSIINSSKEKTLEEYRKEQKLKLEKELIKIESEKFIKL